MWKENWHESMENYTKWWHQEGVILHTGGVLRKTPRTFTKKPAPTNIEQRFTDPEYFAKMNEHHLSRFDFPADALPMAITDYGTVCQAAALGAKQVFGEQSNTVWYEPVLKDIKQPITFDDSNPVWAYIKEGLKRNHEVSMGRYLVGAPGMSPGLDTLAALYDVEELMMCLITDRASVHKRLEEIHHIYETMAASINQLSQDQWGGSAFYFFSIWGKGRTTQLQCDNAAMISRDMFDEYVAGYVEKQCKLFDNVLFHVDGTQCLQHVDKLLEIDGINTIQWTPQAGIEQGGNEKWYPLYKKILDAGKSIQVCNVRHDEIMPLVKTLGKNGVFILTKPFDDVEEANRLYKQIKSF